MRRHPFYEVPDIGQMLRRLVESPDLKLTSRLWTTGQNAVGSYFCE
jgi:hypothetical protein